MHTVDTAMLTCWVVHLFDIPLHEPCLSLESVSRWWNKRPSRSNLSLKKKCVCVAPCLWPRKQKGLFSLQKNQSPPSSTHDVTYIYSHSLMRLKGCNSSCANTELNLCTCVFFSLFNNDQEIFNGFKSHYFVKCQVSFSSHETRPDNSFAIHA